MKKSQRTGDSSRPENQVKLNENQISMISNLAKGYFNAGYNCSESVFMAVTEVLRPEYKAQTKLLTGLGGGVGGQGYCCGAVSGAVIASGVFFGRNKPTSGEKKKSYEISQKILELFKEKYGAVNCSDLKPKISELHKKTCCDYVGYAAQITAEIIHAETNKD